MLRLRPLRAYQTPSDLRLLSIYPRQTAESHISVDVYASPEQALRKADAWDLIILDGPARAKAMALEIAEASDLFIQPTKGVIDDMAPAVRMFHELVKHGIPKSKMVFALHGVLASKEIEDGLEYLTEIGRAHV